MTGLLTRPRTIGVATATVAAVSLIGVVLTAGIPDDAGVIHGCYQSRNGQLRVLDPATGTCKSSELPISWNHVGPMGPQGPIGPMGPGPQRATGARRTDRPHRCDRGDGAGWALPARQASACGRTSSAVGRWARWRTMSVQRGAAEDAADGQLADLRDRQRDRPWSLSLPVRSRDHSTSRCLLKDEALDTIFGAAVATGDSTLIHRNTLALNGGTFVAAGQSKFISVICNVNDVAPGRLDSAQLLTMEIGGFF